MNFLLIKQILLCIIDFFKILQDLKKIDKPTIKALVILIFIGCGVRFYDTQNTIPNMIEKKLVENSKLEMHITTQHNNKVLSEIESIVSMCGLWSGMSLIAYNQSNTTVDFANLIINHELGIIDALLVNKWYMETHSVVGLVPFIMKGFENSKCLVIDRNSLQILATPFFQELDSVIWFETNKGRSNAKQVIWKEMYICNIQNINHEIKYLLAFVLSGERSSVKKKCDTSMKNTKTLAENIENYFK